MDPGLVAVCYPYDPSSILAQGTKKAFKKGYLHVPPSCLLGTQGSCQYATPALPQARHPGSVPVCYPCTPSSILAPGTKKALKQTTSTFPQVAF